MSKGKKKSHLEIDFFYSLGPSINDVASLEGGRGGQIDDMGWYEGGRCQRKSDIVHSRLADYDFFDTSYRPISSIWPPLPPSKLATSFMDGPILRLRIFYCKKPKMGWVFLSRTRKFEYINEYGSPSGTRLCTQISEYVMATRTRLCTQSSEKLAQYWWDIQHYNFFLEIKVDWWKTWTRDSQY